MTTVEAAMAFSSSPEDITGCPSLTCRTEVHPNRAGKVGREGRGRGLKTENRAV